MKSSFPKHNLWTWHWKPIFLNDTYRVLEKKSSYEDPYEEYILLLLKLKIYLLISFAHHVVNLCQLFSSLIGWSLLHTTTFYLHCLYLLTLAVTVSCAVIMMYVSQKPLPLTTSHCPSAQRRYSRSCSSSPETTSTGQNCYIQTHFRKFRKKIHSILAVEVNGLINDWLVVSLRHIES